jgi:DNA-directed RNA polymerase subunit beta'
MITLFTMEETGETKLLLREVQLFDIQPREVNFVAETTDEDISIVPVTQLNFRDGDKVRSLNGGALTKTSLILHSKEKYADTKGLVEISNKDMNIIFQENIILRSERVSSTVTEILVSPGDFINAKTPIAKIQSIAKLDGKVHINQKDASRILIATESDFYKLESPTAPKLNEGDYVLAGSPLSKDIFFPESGLVTKINGKTLTIRKARPFLISYQTRLHVDNSSFVSQGDQLATIVYERIKTGDIVQGLPKVEELLEGRKPKDPGLIADMEGTVEIITEDGIDTLFINHKDERKEYPIPPGQNIVVNNGQKVKVGDSLTDGQPNPHEILLYQGVEPLQQFLVDEVQSVYTSQGVEIANKHLEVIVRQMTRKVKIDDPGDTELLQGEMHDTSYVNQVNSLIEAEGKIAAGYTPVLLGLTKASLNTESFISAASFQETTRILAEASIKGKMDWLHGLKENVIIGRLIPSGTGFEASVDGEEILSSEADNRIALMDSI